MNPQDAIAIQAMKARLSGTPMPSSTQIAPGAQVPQTTPIVPAQNPMPVGDRQLGDMTHKRQPTESDTLAKNVIAGTAHTDPRVQVMSKALLQHLIPYLGKGTVGQQTP